MPLQRILVPVDFSPLSHAAYRKALELAQLGRATLDLLHVVPAESRAEMYLDAAVGRPIGRVPDEILAAAVARLRDFAAAFAGHERPVNQLVEPGDAAATTVRLASELKHDLIVMGTHGRVGLSHLILGSVAQRVLTSAPCPVMTLRL